MITVRLTTEELDRFLGIAAFVDNKMPNIKKPRCVTNFELLDVSPDKNSYKDSVATPARPRIIPTSKQLSIYDFILLLLIDVKADGSFKMNMQYFCLFNRNLNR